MAHRTQIMYIERKVSLSGGEARIGRVTYSKSGGSLTYGGRTYQSLKGSGYKRNYVEVESGERYWISGPKKRGDDRLYGERVPVYIDEDVRVEYWEDVRNAPERVGEDQA